MLEVKKHKNIGFRAKNGELVKTLVNRLNQLHLSQSRSGREIDAKNVLSLLVALYSQLRDMSSMSRLKGHLSYIYCPTASQPVDP